MSETDDTDDLLLIPPDQFVPEVEVIDTITNGPYFHIVESLITQVNHLHTRVHSIEKLDDMDSSQRYKSSDDILRDGYFNSTFSTPQKPRIRYRANSQSPQKQKSRFTLTSNSKYMQKRQNMQDLDDYINTATNMLDSKKTQENNDIVEVNGRIINLAEIENMLDEIEIQKRKNDLRLRENEESMQKSYAWRMGDNVKTLPPACQTLSYQSNYNDMTKTTVTNNFASSKSNLSNSGDKASVSSTDSSVLTTRHVPPLSETLQNLEDDNDTGRSQRLLSLKDLWGQSEQVVSLTERLQEEQLRRQHCEELIHELQTKSLEIQERLAVAIQVDKTKDKALSKFHDSWEKITSKLKTLIDENSKLEMIIQDLYVKNEHNMQECCQKLKYYETEATKALNLAHSNNEKILQYKTMKSQLEETIQSLEKRVKEVQVDHDTEIKKSQTLNDIIIQKEIELNENKSLLSDSRIEVANSKKAIEQCQEEFSTMTSQYNQLDSLLNEKQTTIHELEGKVKNLQADNDNLKILQVDAQNELLSTKDKMEQTKSELRDFYQQQVELLVQDKLKEFQTQLDKAETSLQDEITKRELSIAKTAATHIQQITDKHTLEIKLLEEKQKEEIKYYQLQLQQAQQHISSQQSKLKHFHERRSHLAQQLHKVMEVQWMEALKIINNTKSPYNSTPFDSTIDQLRTLKVKSHNNLEEVLSDPGEYLLEEKTTDINVIAETPVSSKVHSSKAQRDLRETSNDFQKYMQILLNRETTATQVESLKEATQNAQTQAKRNRR